MQLSGHMPTLLGALLLALLLSVVSARSLSLKDRRHTHTCSPHMACAWAICPWRTYSVPAFPDDGDCIVIENHTCACYSTYGCQLTDLMELNRENVKYEYRCMSPEVTREIYQIGRRRRRRAGLLASGAAAAADAADADIPDISAQETEE